MGTYASPLTETIARGSMGDLMQNNNLAAEVALRAQQAQEAQQRTQAQDLANQQTRLDMADQQTLRGAFADPDKRKAILSGDLSGIGDVQPKTMIGLNSSLLDMRTKVATLDKDEAANRHDALGDISKFIDGVKSAIVTGPDGQPDLSTANSQWQSGIQNLYNNRTLQRAGISVAPPTNITDPKQLDQWATQIGTEHDLIGMDIARREAAGKATKEQAEGTKEALITQAMQAALKDPTQGSALIDKAIPPTLDAQANTGYKAAWQAAMNAGKPDLAAEIVKTAAAHGAGMSPGAIKTAATKAGAEETARTNAQVAALGGSGDQPGALAQSVANYQVPFSQAAARLSAPAREALMKQVLAITPAYQESQYPVAQATEKDATTGKIATSANALNTMMGHLDVLDKASAALKNGDIQAINKIANAVGAQTGSTARTTYDTIVHRLGPEVTKAYLAAGGSVGERGTNEEDFSSSLSPDQIHSNISISAKLADSKIKALQDQYSRGTYNRGKQKLISDEAEATRNRLAGGGAAGFSVTTPNGKVYSFKSQADADAFKVKAGIK